jgi:hypothetical protein
MFDSSCAVKTDDLNKLMGFVDCNSSVHVQSARIGWRYNGNKIELWTYIYFDAKRITNRIAEVDLNEWFDCEIGFTKQTYFFSVNGVDAFEPRSNICTSGFYFILQPYFGGNDPAPQDVNVFVRW